MYLKILMGSILMVTVIAVGALLVYGRGYWYPVYIKVAGARTVVDVINTYGDQARSTMAPYFSKANVAYPPKQLSFVAIKETGVLEVWALNDQTWSKINTYPIKAASGTLGPKLREGDKQVPEGIYKIVGLNPNSAYHLSMKLNYPNTFDQMWAEEEGRTEPGSNIFIHGKALSIGCLAMGDDAIEALFVLSHDVGIANIDVIIAPTDPRERALVPPVGSKPWVSALYSTIEQKIVTHYSN